VPSVSQASFYRSLFDPAEDQAAAPLVGTRVALETTPFDDYGAADTASIAKTLDELQRSCEQQLNVITQLRRRLATGAEPERARRPWLQPQHIAAGIAALVVALVVIAIAVAPDDSRAPETSSTSAGAGAGAEVEVANGGHDHSAAAAPAAKQTAHSDHATSMGSGVGISLSEFKVAPRRRSVKAGDTTFVIRNEGKLEHEFMVIRADDVRGSLSAMSSEEIHDRAVHSTHGIQPGDRVEAEVRLKKGRYILFCNLPGHLAEGQQTRLTVI
jgi:uncharacterized cupredoxin-like copper-binding protein